MAGVGDGGVILLFSFVSSQYHLKKKNSIIIWLNAPTLERYEINSTCSKKNETELSVMLAHDIVSTLWFLIEH